MLLFLQPKTQLAFRAASAHCRLTSSFSFTSTPNSFSAGLLSIHSSSTLCWYWGLPQPRCRTLHMALFNFRRFAQAHSSSLPRSLWVAALPSTAPLSLVSPANLPRIRLIPLSMSHSPFPLERCGKRDYHWKMRQKNCWVPQPSLRRFSLVYLWKRYPSVRMSNSPLGKEFSCLSWRTKDTFPCSCYSLTSQSPRVFQAWQCPRKPLWEGFPEKKTTVKDKRCISTVQIGLIHANKPVTVSYSSTHTPVYANQRLKQGQSHSPSKERKVSHKIMAPVRVTQSWPYIICRKIINVPWKQALVAPLTPSCCTLLSPSTTRLFFPLPCSHFLSLPPLGHTRRCYLDLQVWPLIHTPLEPQQLISTCISLACARGGAGAPQGSSHSLQLYSQLKEGTLSHLLASSY